MKRIVLFSLALIISSDIGGAAKEPQSQSSDKQPPATQQSNQTGTQPQQGPQSNQTNQNGQTGSQAQPGQRSKTIVIDRRKLPLADRPNVSILDVNTFIGVDTRVIVMMAALNVAGYNYESSNRQLSELRQQIREDLKGLNPDLVQRLRAYFEKHRKGENDVTAVSPYLSLALSMAAPPAFTIDTPSERLPGEVREIADFPLLLEEFYHAAGFSKLMPKYVEAYMKFAETYAKPTSEACGMTLSYLHTDPILELPPLFKSRKTESKAEDKKNEKKDEKKNDKKGDKNTTDIVDKKTAQNTTLEPIPNRVREFIIMPDLLNATGVANLRIVADNYYLLLGPSSIPNIEAIRRSFLTFVLDPLAEKQVKEVAAIRSQLKKLMDSRGKNLSKEYSERNAYFLITDSLVRAADARMDALGYAARRKSSEDEALYELSQAYDHGAVLSYHFYNQLKAYEAVGVNINDYLPAMLGEINFDKESKRLVEYANQIEHGKQLHEEASIVSAIASAPPKTISNANEKVVAQIVEADQLIKAHKYDEAETTLKSALKDNPNNARALYGMADLMSKKATSNDDPDRVEEFLYAAVEYYKKAASNASPETEKWLMQRSYVAAAKILDFIASANPTQAEKLSSDASAAYEKAVQLGKVEGGAFEEAQTAVKERAQKQKQ